MDSDSGDETGNTYGEARGHDWQKADRDLMKEGYREGLDEARNSEVQKYFEIGQQLIFKNTYRLGQLKGILLGRAMAQTNNTEIPTSLQEILNDIHVELKRIKGLKLPEGQDFDEFIKSAKEDMNQHFEDLKFRLVTEDPQSQVHIDSMEVGIQWPEIESASATVK